jgi:hypothetical protein
MEFSKTEELVVITSMKGTTTGEDLSEEVKKPLQSVDIQRECSCHKCSCSYFSNVYLSFIMCGDRGKE